jgi:hypothetical protein
MSAIVLLLIVLITLYLANQGMLSSLLAFATSTFASILAMALLEPAQGVIAGWRPVYARGATFLVLFLVTFLVLRFAADAAVPKNIKLSKMVNRVAGGVIGFFTALVVMGTTLIGVEMLPIGRTVLGYDRFPGEHHMQAIEGDKTNPGEVAKMHNVWLSPDRFVLAVWKGAAGGGIGLPSWFSAVHPDLSVESYGYRNQFPGSSRYLHGELLSVPDNGCAWLGADKKLTTADGVTLPVAGQRLLMVRSEISQGSAAPKIATDSVEDPYLRIAASQVRLVTNKGRQHYPVGYMEGGRNFVTLPLDVGFLVDDFKGSKAIEDWIFQVADDETPAMLEIKQLARAELRDPPKDRTAQPLASSEYPPHAYYKDLCTLKVTFDPNGATLKAARVYVLRSSKDAAGNFTGATRADLPTSTLRAAHEHVLAWSGQAKPGVPAPSLFSQAANSGRDFLNGRDEDPVRYGMLIPLLLLGETQNDGGINLQHLPVYFDTTVMDILKGTRKGSLVVGQAESDASGRAEIQKILPGLHPVIITLLTDKGFYVWARDDMNFPALDSKNQPLLDADKKPQPISFRAAIGGGGEPTTFQIDLDEKAP